MSRAPAITVTTAHASGAQAELAGDVLHAQRRRLLDLLRELPRHAWAAPTRCPDWSVQDVVRHLCDVSAKWLAVMRGSASERSGLEALDPRTTPAEWLSQSASDSPHDTIARFERVSRELLDEVDRRRARRDDARVSGLPYGPVPWSVVALHVFWDAWVHERDIVRSLGRPHVTTPTESRAAAAFGLLIAGMPFMLASASFDEVIVLEGDGGGRYELAVHDGTVTVGIDVAQAEDGALRGVLPDVVDALVGRDPDLMDALEGPRERINALGTLRRFMLASPNRMEMPS